MRQGEAQADHGSTGCARRQRGEQHLPGAAIRLAREQLVAIDQVEQRHRFAAQCMDDVAIVHHMAATTAVDAASAPQGLHQRAAEEAFQPIVIQPDPQTITDQP